MIPCCWCLSEAAGPESSSCQRERESASFLASGFFFSTGQPDNGQQEKIVEHLRAVYESSLSTRPLVAPSSRVLQSVFSNFSLMQCTLSSCERLSVGDFFFFLRIFFFYAGVGKSSFNEMWFNFFNTFQFLGVICTRENIHAPKMWKVRRAANTNFSCVCMWLNLYDVWYDFNGRCWDVVWELTFLVVWIMVWEILQLVISSII